MRDILFRGKSVDSGNWFEGSLVHQTAYYGDPVDRYYILYNGEFDGDYYAAVEVIPKTVGQYIGYEDKNGNKIFEGDAIRDRISDINYSRTYVITYDGASFCYATYDEFKNGRSGDVIDDCEYGLCLTLFEVLGNIHDNPELLKGEIIWE